MGHGGTRKGMRQCSSKLRSSRCAKYWQLLAAADGVRVTGYVRDSDLGALLQAARLFIVPIRWATGVITKQSTAHVHGLPTGARTIAITVVAPPSPRRCTTVSLPK